MEVMRLGAIFPQTEIGADPVAIREYAQAVEEMGFDHIATYEHVLGASTATRPNWTGPYTSETMFHEPFVLFGYLAAVTQRVELALSVLVLPQRQTALVAKQAAEVDVLSGGRLRLGIGVGWNRVEYDALGESFATRGARSEEQIAVLRALWSEPVVTFAGRWHHIEAAGINPLPVRRSIPIWIGGQSERTLRRTARLADGWFPQAPPNEQGRALVERLRGYLREAGRPEDALGIEPRLSVRNVPEGQWRAYLEDWQALGATHLSVNTMDAGLRTPREHVDLLRRVLRALR
jgi:probable F420-dependent oxidoreductase